MSNKPLAAVLALMLVPLAVCTYVPATDLPSHLAISGILARLLQGDPVTQLHYALNPQPTPYYLAYVLLAPCVAVAGPWVGARLAMAVVAALFAVATQRLVRAAELPAWTLVAAPFLFYGPLFFWGFVATLVGVPFVLLCAAELLLRHRAGRGHALPAMGYAGVAVLAHVALAAPVALCVGAYGSLAPRRRWPLWSGAVALLAACVLAIAAQSQLSQYETVDSAWHHIKTHLGPFDKGAGRAAHTAWLLALLALQARRPATAARRFGRVLALGSLALFLLCPPDLRVNGKVAWGLNFRFLTVAEAGLLLGMAPPVRWTRPCAAMAGSVGLVFVAAVGWLCWQFDRAAQPLAAVLAELPAGSALQPRVAPARFAQAWPPLGAHLPDYFVAARPGYQAGLFMGAHIPIRETGATPQAGQRGGMGAFDYVVAQDGGGPPPPDGVLVLRTARWQLYRRAGTGVITGDLAR